VGSMAQPAQQGSSQRAVGTAKFRGKLKEWPKKSEESSGRRKNVPSNGYKSV
jgi:hypothetical protein